jgi:hypothetical protein
VHVRPALQWVTLATLLAAVAAAPAGASQTATVTIGGDAHDVTVPDGWTTSVSDAGVQFVPPPRYGSLQVSIVGIDMPPGTSDPAEVARALADNERRAKSWLVEAPPESVEFVGAPGSLVALAGQPSGGAMQAEMFVVSVAHGNVYLFTCEGTLSEVKSAVDDLAVIIGGVRLAGETGAAKPGPSGRELGTLLGRAKGGGAADDVGPGVTGGIARQIGKQGGGGKNGGRGDWLLVDEAFGVKLKAEQLRRWRLDIADDEYTLERTDEDPHAVVSLRRVAIKNRKAYEKQATAEGRSKKTRFAGADALLVEKKSGDTVIRRYHMIRDDHALVFEFRVVGRAGDTGVDARVFEIEQAAVLDDKGLSAWSDGATEITMYGGVRLATTAGWKLADVGPGRANFTNAKGVEVEVRVRPWPSNKDPFADAEGAVKDACGKESYTRADAAVLGAKQATRLRCAAKSGAKVVLVAEGQGVDGARLYVRVSGQNAKKKGEPTDAEIAEFGSYVTLPR